MNRFLALQRSDFPFKASAVQNHGIKIPPVFLERYISTVRIAVKMRLTYAGCDAQLRLLVTGRRPLLPMNVDDLLVGSVNDGCGHTLLLGRKFALTA